jgi:hypothetical protein
LSGPGTETEINQKYSSDIFQAIGLDIYDGSIEEVNQFRSTGISYPLCTQASGTRTAYQAFEDHDVSVVIDQQGILRYKVGGVNVNEIRNVIDNLIATTDTKDEILDRQLPVEFTLDQNYPNPFNPSTKISFSLTEQSLVTLEVYSLLGKKVATLVENTLTAGFHQVLFDADNLPAGIYFYKIDAGKFSAVRKMSLVK